MKKHVLFLVGISLLAAGCSSLQDPSKRTSTQTMDFFAPTANTAYYEFTSSPLDRPSVLEEPPAEEPAAPTDPEADEDFTAENVSGAYGTYGDVVVNVASHKFKLGPSASRQEMQYFQKALDEAYTVVLRQYRPVGFTYAMSSVGAVNPLSDIEVSCKLSERSANQVGQATCNGFFKTVAARYQQFIKGSAR